MLPADAERAYAENRALIDGIFEYRTVKYAITQVKRGEAGAKIMADNPDLLKAIERLRRVQQVED